MTELGLVGTEELVEEVLKRFDDAIFVGIQRRSTETGITASYFTGDLYACMGLSVMAQHHLSDVLLEHAEEKGSMGDAN